MPLRNLYWPLLLASLSDGSCRIAVNRRRASFDGNACDLALLCTLNRRNTSGGPPRTVPLSCDNCRRASFDGNACDLALLCTPNCRNTPGGSSRTVPLSSDTEEEAAVTAVAERAVVVTEEAATAVVVTAAMVGTRPQCRRGGY
jgi:hypothetical protein